MLLKHNRPQEIPVQEQWDGQVGSFQGLAQEGRRQTEPEGRRRPWPEEALERTLVAYGSSWLSPPTVCSGHSIAVAAVVL